jgi:hypothetical protein
MKAYVFTGPTLPPSQAPEIDGIVYLPPAKQGDVYRVARSRPAAIGIVDGYFENVPSVWHKEVLWAMSNGVHVFGAASMGALRAAELEAFGMQGVGFVFEAYRDGLIEDDDEVAVVHGPSVPEYGARDYESVTEAMVNVRATLAQALAAGVVTERFAERVFDQAKDLFYRDRTWERILDGLAIAGSAQAERLANWLPDNGIDQKRIDALEMLEVMQAALAGALTPKRVDYRFEHTVKWDGLVVRANADTHALAGATSEEGGEGLLEELRIEAVHYESVWRHSLLRAVAATEASRSGEEPGDARIEQTERRFLAEHAIASEADRARWLADHAMRPDGFARLMSDEARIAWLTRSLSPIARHHLADELRAAGHFTRLAQRATDKRRTLAAWGIEQPTLDAAGIDEPALLRWYFRERLAIDVPSDLGAFANRLGFRSRNTFLTAMLREYCYLKRQGESAT